MTKPRLLTLALLCVLVIGGVAFALGRTTGTGGQAVAVDPHGVALPAERTVQLSYTMPGPSASDGLHAKLIAGEMPSTAVEATVLSDEDCAPNGLGISHCLNRLRLGDGTEIVVRHPHDMDVVPCLSPGENVRLLPA